jgi:hypothetical protein
VEIVRKEQHLGWAFRPPRYNLRFQMCFNIINTMRCDMCRGMCMCTGEREMQEEEEKRGNVVVVILMSGDIVMCVIQSCVMHKEEKK